MSKLLIAAFEEKLTVDNAALLLVDHQTGLLQFLPSVEPMKLKQNILGLAHTAKRLNLPVVLTTSWPLGPNGPFLPDVAALFPDNEIIDRDTVDIWDHAPSVAAIKATGRKKLIIAGLDTTTCLGLATVGALRAGYDVYAVVDASSTFDAINEQAAMIRLASAGAVVTTWIPVLAELARSTVQNGIHIADLLRAHTGSYAAVFDNFKATAKTAETVEGQLDQAREAYEASQKASG